MEIVVKIVEKNGCENRTVIVVKIVVEKGSGNLVEVAVKFAGWFENIFGKFFM